MTPGEAGAGIPSIRPVSGIDPPRMTGRTIPGASDPAAARNGNRQFPGVVQAFEFHSFPRLSR